MRAVRLRTEYLTDPIGIDIVQPRLSWNCEGGIKQTAYRVAAYTGDTRIWDSGKVSSARMTGIVFPPMLGSRQRVDWTVTLWDENDRAGEESRAFFETGLLHSSDLKAKWISGNYRVDPRKRYPVDCFRKRFTAIGIVRARLYITACGLYEAKLNGKRAGDFVLAPGHTDSRKRIQLQTIDVTELIRGGSNELTVQLADGWYRGSTGAWGLRNQYGTKTKLYVQLELTDRDGRTQEICSDESWDWSCYGPIRFADNKDGEIVEAYRTPSYAGKARLAKCRVLPAASNNVPVTEHERFKPVLLTTPKGSKVLDFGQNLAGYCAFRLNARRGQKLVLRFGETLDGSGEFTQKNFQCVNKKIATPLQRIVYTCKEGVNEYKTTFAVFGFRYALIETDIAFSPDDFTAVAVYSDVRDTGAFSCSNELINKFVSATRWSAKSNLLDVPTDCPTRERHGWTGDAQVFVKTACYLFDYAPFARKYLHDIYDFQPRSGKLPQIAPVAGVDLYMKVMDGSVGWADAGVIIPYTLWKQYGDDRILSEFYEGMKKYARFMMRRCGKWYPLSRRVRIPRRDKKYLANKGQSFGEWAEPKEIRPFAVADFIFTHPEEGTAYTAYVMGMMSEIAGVLGKEEDKALYDRYREGCKQAYRALIKSKGYSLDTDRQAKLVRPLYMGLPDEKDAAYAKERLLLALEHFGWRLGTGFLSTPFILYVLKEIGPEYAYRLLENERMPGWLFMVKSGATTVWESWEGTEAQGLVASLNHYSKGAVCSFLFDTVCGVSVGAEENSFVVAPTAGGSLTHAEASYLSIYGKIESGWKREGGHIVYTVTVPANTAALFCLPDGTKTMLTAGTHRIER